MVIKKIEKNNIYYLESNIIFYSHNIEKNIFDDWNDKIGSKLNDPIMLIFIKDNKIKIQIELKKTLSKTKNINKILKIGERIITCIAVSLNIASVGVVWFLPYLSPTKFMLRKNDDKEFTHNEHHISVEKFYRDKKQKLTYNQIDNALTIFTKLLQFDDYYFKRYIGGMTMLTVNNHNYNFAEEIFANFYKTIERLASRELKKDNEQPSQKDLQGVFKKLGLDSDDYMDEIKNLYIIRGTTIMHSVGNDKNITLEDSLKVKILADYLAFKILTKRVKDEFDKDKD